MTLRTVSAREASMFACFADAVVAAGAPLPAIADTDAASYFDDLLGHSPPLNRAGLRVILHLVELGPLALGYRRRLRRLDRARRVEYLTRLSRGRLAFGLDALGIVAKLGYYGDDRVMGLLGYDADAVVARGRELRRAQERW